MRYVTRIGGASVFRAFRVGEVAANPFPRAGGFLPFPSARTFIQGAGVLKMDVKNQRMHVVGVKRSKGEYEGKPFDSTKLYVNLDLNNSTDQGRGFATVEYTWGKSDNFDKIKHLPFPFDADVDLSFVTNGKGGMVAQVVDVHPVSLAKKAA